MHQIGVKAAPEGCHGYKVLDVDGDVLMVLAVVPKEVVTMETVDLEGRLVYYHGNRVLAVGKDVPIVIVVEPNEMVTFERVDLARSLVLYISMVTRFWMWAEMFQWSYWWCPRRW